MKKRKSKKKRLSLRMEDEAPMKRNVMGPGKGGRRVKGKDYPEYVEMEERHGQMMDNNPILRSTDIADHLKRSESKKGYSKKPRVIPQKKKGIRSK